MKTGWLAAPFIEPKSFEIDPVSSVDVAVNGQWLLMLLNSDDVVADDHALTKSAQLRLNRALPPKLSWPVTLNNPAGYPWLAYKI